MLEREPIYAPVWDHPEFQTMMAEVEAEMAVQLAKLREMERGGELAAIRLNWGALQHGLRPR